MELKLIIFLSSPMPFNFKLDHYGIEILISGGKYPESGIFKLDHYGIEIIDVFWFCFVVSAFKLDHYGIEIYILA